MPIDIDCYTNIPPEIAQKKLGDFIVENFSVLGGYYKFYDVWKVFNETELLEIEDKTERYHKESISLLAKEHGFNKANSLFLISVVDKSFSRVSLNQLISMLSDKFGCDNILILLNSEPIDRACK